MGPKIDQNPDAAENNQPSANTVNDGTTVSDVQEDEPQDHPSTGLSQFAWQLMGDTTAVNPPANVDATEETAGNGGLTEVLIAQGPTGGQDVDIEKMRQAIIDADKEAPEALRNLKDGRTNTLDLIKTLISAESSGKPEETVRALEALKQAELKQAHQYIEYLKPGTARADLGSALIAKGDDASIREGERKLVEAVQARPDLVFHPNFRAQILDAYTKMATYRQENGLPPWKGDIDIKDLLPQNPQQAPFNDKTSEHFQTANDQYWKTGIKDALPEFQKAIGASDQTAEHNKDLNARRNLETFVSALTTDRAIAQAKVQGESTTELEKRRTDIWREQTQNYVDASGPAQARMNTALAMIASGDASMITGAKQHLVDATEKYPGLVFGNGMAIYSNEFNDRLFGAYKANLDNSGTRPADGPGGTTGGTTTEPESMRPQGEDKLNLGYQQVDVANNPLPGAADDKEYQPYVWDTATSIALPIAVIGLGIVAGRRQYRAVQQRRAIEAEYNLEAPTKTTGADRVTLRTSETGPEQQFELKGRRGDQVILKNSNATTDGATRPAIDPPEGFDPRKGKFVDYQPIKVDGNKYYVNNKGEAFEYRGGKLHPTDAVRGMSIAEYSSRELSALPKDMPAKAVEMQGLSLTPIGALADGRIVMRNGTTGGAAMRDTIAVPDGVDPLKGEFNNLKHQRLAGNDYFISPDNKVFTFLEKPARQMLQVHDIVVQPPDEVYRAGGAPGSSAEERAVNRQINDILEPLRQRLRSGEPVDVATREAYYAKAREALMPRARQAAKALGLPEDVITEQSFRFGETGSQATHDRRTGEIVIDVNTDNPLTAVEHELKHRQRALNMTAAAEADPAGFRLAIMDRTLQEIGKPGRRLTDSGIDSRPRIEDPRAVEALQKQVQNQVLYELAKEGKIPWSKVPLGEIGQEPPKILSDALGGPGEAIAEIQRETQNALQVIDKNAIARDAQNEGSQRYIDQKVAEYKQGMVGTAGGEATLRTNAGVKQLVESVQGDTLALYHQTDRTLDPYYRFSGDELAARQHQVERALIRLNAELKEGGSTTAVADHPEGKKLVERQQIINLQQQLIGEHQNGNTTKAKEIAADLLTRMSKEPARYLEDVKFMRERELLTAEQVGKTPFDALIKAQQTSGGGTGLEQARAEQQSQAQSVVAANARRGELKGANLESPVALASGGTEYKLKTPVTIDGGTEFEAKVTAIVEKDGRMQLTYIDKAGRTHTSAMAYDVYMRSVEIAAERPGNPYSNADRAKLAADYLTEAAVRERAFDRSVGSVAALDEPVDTTTGGGSERRLDLNRLDSQRSLIVGSDAFRADKGQARVYDLLASRDGILAQLRNSGAIGKGWEIYPTEPQSPADKVGADYILVNRETGEFHFLDATKKNEAEKKNVFRLRRDGIITYDNQYFEPLGGMLKRPDRGQQATGIELDAQRFEEGLRDQIVRLTSKPSPFNLNETPMPDVRLQTPATTEAQIKRIVDWAAAKSQATGEGPGGDLREMSDVLRTGAQGYSEKVLREVDSPKLEERVRRTTFKEIARYVASKAGGEKYEAERGPVDPPSNIKPHDGKFKLDVPGDNIFVSQSSIENILVTEWSNMIRNPMSGIEQLSRAEIIALDRNLFSKPPFSDKKTTKEFKAEVARAFANRTETGQSHPQHRDVKRVVQKFADAVSSVRSYVEAGGAEGKGQPVIVDNVVSTLQKQNSDFILDRLPPKAPAPVGTVALPPKPGQQFFGEVPTAAGQLKEYMTDILGREPKLGTTPNEQVSEWMDMMADEAEKKNTWGERELSKFKEFAAKYRAGDAAAVKEINDWINTGPETAERATEPPKSDLVREGDTNNGARSPAPNVESPVGQERMRSFKEMLPGLDGLSRPQYLTEVMKKAKSSLSSDVTRGNRLAYLESNVKVQETESLKAGESELVISRGGQVIKPTSFDGTAFVTADGTKVPLKDASIEVRIGRGSSPDQAAREALVRAHDLANIMTGKVKPDATALAEMRALRNAFDGRAVTPGNDGPARPAAGTEISLGGFEFESKRVEVKLTQTGVRFGDRGEVPYEKIVKDTLLERKTELARLEREKGNQQNAELESRIAALRDNVEQLETLSREVGKPESVAKIMKAIQEHATTDRVEQLRQERRSGGGGALKGAVVRGSAYLLVASFVAVTLAGGGANVNNTIPGYAPTTVR